MEVAPFFADFHHFLSIFMIYALLSRFTFCRDLRTFSAIFFGQNSLLRDITRFLHVCSDSDIEIEIIGIDIKIVICLFLPLHQE